MDSGSVAGAERAACSPGPCVRGPRWAALPAALFRSRLPRARPVPGAPRGVLRFARLSGLRFASSLARSGRWLVAGARFAPLLFADFAGAAASLGRAGFSRLAAPRPPPRRAFPPPPAFASLPAPGPRPLGCGSRSPPLARPCPARAPAGALALLRAPLWRSSLGRVAPVPGALRSLRSLVPPGGGLPLGPASLRLASLGGSPGRGCVARLAAGSFFASAPPGFPRLRVRVPSSRPPCVLLGLLRAKTIPPGYLIRDGTKNFLFCCVFSFGQMRAPSSVAHATKSFFCTVFCLASRPLARTGGGRRRAA